MASYGYTLPTVLTGSNSIPGGTSTSKGPNSQLSLMARLPKRIVSVLSFLFVLLMVDLFWTHKLVSPPSGKGYVSGSQYLKKASKAAKAVWVNPLAAYDPADLDSAMVEMLDKAKKAMEADEPKEDIVAHADKVIIWKELDAFGQNLRQETHKKLNTTTYNAYQKSIKYHSEELFAHLFPFVSKSDAERRTLQMLSERATRPRGIVIPVGRDQFQYALHLIATLKHVHETTLPIQVVHSGGGDLPNEMKAALRAVSPDVETVDLLHIFDEAHVSLEGSGWAIKPFAVLASPFVETIIMDADAVFMQDPMNLFADPGYLDRGTLFFRDREIFPGDGNVHQWWRKIMKGREPSDELRKSRWYNDQVSREEVESGVVVVNKGIRDVLLGLVFVGHMNIRIVRDEVTYKNTYGDKESFWMAFELCQIPYHIDPPYASTLGNLVHPDKSHTTESRICSDHHFHLDHKGRPFWFNGSLFQDKRNKGKGFFMPQVWSYGTVDWDCEKEPWCMRGIREQDVFKLSDGGWDRVLTDMIGAGLVWDSRFPTLVDKHTA